MRRIILTLAVALFSVTAPVSPAGATVRVKATHHSAHRPSPLALAIDKLQDHREWIERQTQHSLTDVATHFHLTLQQMLAKWQRVAICEVNGNWGMEGPSYSGIGFANTTWDSFGGRKFAPEAGDATRMEQVLVGMQITKTWIPDQYGCAIGGW